MKVKIRNKIYSGDREPVMIILSEQDKQNIANMIPNATKYCVYPEFWEKDILDWMNADDSGPDVPKPAGPITK